MQQNLFKVVIFCTLSVNMYYLNMTLIAFVNAAPGKYLRNVPQVRHLVSAVLATVHVLCPICSEVQFEFHGMLLGMSSESCSAWCIQYQNLHSSAIFQSITRSVK